MLENGTGGLTNGMDHWDVPGLMTCTGVGRGGSGGGRGGSSDNRLAKSSQVEVDMVTDDEGGSTTTDGEVNLGHGGSN